MGTRRLGAAAAALIALATSALPATAEAAGAWTAPTAISAAGADRPRVTITEDGVAVAAWSGTTVQAATRRRGVRSAPPRRCRPSPER